MISLLSVTCRSSIRDHFEGERVGMPFPLFKAAGTHGNGVSSVKVFRNARERNTGLLLYYYPSKLRTCCIRFSVKTGAEMHQNAQIINVKNFLGAMPPDPYTGEWLRRPSPDPNSSALRHFAPTASRWGPRPLHRPPTSIPIVPVLRKDH